MSLREKHKMLLDKKKMLLIDLDRFISTRILRPPAHYTYMKTTQYQYLTVVIAKYINTFYQKLYTCKSFVYQMNPNYMLLSALLDHFRFFQQFFSARSFPIVTAAVNLSSANTVESR